MVNGSFIAVILEGTGLGLNNKADEGTGTETGERNHE